MGTGGEQAEARGPGQGGVDGRAAGAGRATASARIVGPCVLVFGVSQVALGAWMAVAPRSFFDAIGGFGPFNDHYVRDVSTFYLAVGIALLVAWRRPGWRVPVLAVAVLQYAFHVVNHVADVGDGDPGWVGPVDVISLTVGALAFALVLAGSFERRRSS
jgi:hypothetical protein